MGIGTEHRADRRRRDLRIRAQPRVDIDVVGWILMLAGVVGLLFTTLVTRRSRERTVVRREPADREIVREKPKEREVIRERDPRW